MNSATTCRSVSIRYCSTLSLTRSRCDLWQKGEATYQQPGHRRGHHSACYRASRSPWQNPYVERVIGSIRRDCLDHMIIINQRHLRRTLRNYFDYYHSCRTHLSLNKDPPDSRAVESVEYGNIVALPRVGGLHHRYTRIAA